ncbi:two-component sensor histidine kinase [Aeromicrobium flavum]|uniref:histidine kinase n=1 Tax=Aeromicrobium flavum TaxID=416568 RepID=A0A512HWW1_9ACTN|nr:ATP-binding protein [Aeromicrobium flavum]GEO89931.1 two-component sensor histidine kinase [Aeromicrobium flavum]
MRRRWGSFSVRSRLIVAIAALVGATLLAAGITMWVVESRRIDQGIDAAITQEFAEFRASFGADEQIGADARLEAFLARTLPDNGEVVWAFPATGSPQYIGNSDRNLLDSPRFTALVRDLRTTGGMRTFESGGRRYRVGVLTVRQGDQTAALVVSRNRTLAQERLTDLLTTYALVGLLSLVIVVAASSWLAGRLLAPLTRLRHTARDISAGSLDERLEVTGHDDLTDLQITFNAMLDRLEAAFATQRRMLDDAGHELRTPLTVLRGHIEVMSERDPEDVLETKALLLDEIDRMSRLVDELLVLAKARRPDFVRLEPVDLEVLGQGVIARCRALADRDWRTDLAASGEALLDGQRITQAMLQFADNAVRHTQDGDTITIGSSAAGGVVEFWVADDGPGVPAELRAEIFDRFTTTGSHDGFGLGLSIVSAIAEAHGGAVVLDESPPGSGAVFRLRLPIVEDR